MALSALLPGQRVPSGVPARPDASGGWRVLCDVGHPAQVHLFRNALAELERRGHETFVTSRRKEMTVGLLEAYDIDHLALSARGETVPGLVAELLVREARLLRVARRFDPDVILSRIGLPPAHVSAVLGCRHVVVSDTSVESRLLGLLTQRAAFPFVDAVCAPDSLDLPVPADRRRHLAFQELAYLHPRYFSPDPTVPAAYDLERPYFVIRAAGWDAYHDVGHRGLSPDGLRALVDRLSPAGEVLVSAEGELPPDLEPLRLQIAPADVHDLLYYADWYVGDSGTMSTEAAMLGTPAIRTNSMVGPDDEQVFRDLEDRYGLLRSFADESEAIDAVAALLDEGSDPAVWRERRERLLEDQPDPTEHIVEAVLDVRQDEQFHDSPYIHE